MADIKLAYGTSTAITITLASLASSSTAARECTAIDNGTNKFLDAMVYLAIPLQTGTPSSDKSIYVYAYASEDGTNYGDNATGSDAAVTLRSPTNLFGPVVVACPDAGGLTYKRVIPSICEVLGCKVLPRKWGIVVQNYTGVTFHATEGSIIKTYTGIYQTSA
jgi:hypothetical protein